VYCYGDDLKCVFRLTDADKKRLASCQSTHTYVADSSWHTEAECYYFWIFLISTAF